VAPPVKQIRAGRHLAVYAVIVVGLYLLVFFTGGGKPTPRLGIDLQGGTQVTLTARSPDGKPPSADALNQARQIIQNRVNGSGINGAEIVQDNNNLVITAPGGNGEQIKNLGQSAKLTFRKVVNAVAVTPPPKPSTPPSSGQQPSSGAPTPQGMGAPGAAQDPLSTSPQQASTPPSGAAAPSSAAPSSSAPSSAAPSQNNNVDPKVAQEIQAAKALRQSTDQQVQAQALSLLNCGAADPLRGNDDPNLPLVTCSQDGTEKYVLDPVFLQGSEIAHATAGTDPQGAGFVVNLTFKDNGSRIWGDFTSANVQQRAAFVLDTQVVSAPTIQQAILGGNTQISGKFTQTKATDLANVLNYGALPLSFEQSDVQTVSATLGIASLQAGLLAGGIGLLLVIIYCLFYYRALGVLTVVSLGLSGTVIYAILVLLGRWLGFSLDLAGVAGFIVAIGFTADSFVIFFERLKDEIREGRTFRSGVARGWVRARRTILSSDAVMFLAAAVLYALAVGQVQGFAFTLGMSTVLDLVVVFLVTHPLVVLASRSKTLSSPAFSGLGAVQRLGAAHRAATLGASNTAVKEA
jgi:preprotein translocase subunit SecD